MFNFIIAKIWYQWCCKKNLKIAVVEIAMGEHRWPLNSIKLAREYDDKGGGKLKEKISAELENALKVHIKYQISIILRFQFYDKKYREAIQGLQTLKRYMKNACDKMSISEPEIKVNKVFMKYAIDFNLEFEGKVPETMEELKRFICQTGLDRIVSFLPSIDNDYSELRESLNDIIFYCSEGGLEYPASFRYFENSAYWAGIEKFTEESVYALKKIMEYAHKLKMSFDFRELEAVQRKIESVTKRVREEKLKTAVN